MKIKSNPKLIYILFFALSFILYGNTITHEYALDDAIVITNNEFTQQGFSGISDIFAHESFTGFFGKDKQLVAGGRYRPLSIVTFAIEYESFGASPFISHIINILLYALTVISLFVCLKLLFKEYDIKLNTSISFVASIIFLFHPIHTEVVANIKGRDEILTLLGSLVAFIYILKSFDNNLKKTKYLLFASITFFLALLSKENAVTFLGIIPLSLIIFRKASIKNSIAYSLPLLGATIVFLIIRHNVLGGFPQTEEISELLNNPFINADNSQKYATIFYTLLLYIKLLIFPHPLTFDYYPFHIEIIEIYDWRFILSALVYIAIVGLGIYSFLKQKKWSIAIIFYLFPLTIVSNIVFPIGTFMNERFIFISSIGYTIALAFVFVKYSNIAKYRKLSFALAIFLLCGYAAKTIDRNFAWKDDLTLFTTDVKTSYNSAKSTCSAGGKLLEAAQANTNETEKQEQLNNSLHYLRRSISIYPQYTEANLLLGNCHFEFQNYDSSLYYYKKVLQRAPMHELTLKNIEIVMNKVSDTETKLKYLTDFYNINSTNYDINYRLGQTYGKEKGDITRAIFYLERAVKINPNKKESLKDLGVAYGMSNRPEDALLVLKKALQIDTTDFQTYINIGITLNNMGKTRNAQYYFEKARLFQNQNAKQ